MPFNINFLNPGFVHGLEFMSFQRHAMFKELSSYFDSVIGENGRIEECGKELNNLIKKYTGFANLKINLIEYGNLAIDAGYINPGNLFNIDGIEQWLPKGESSLFKWFKDHESNVMKGWIDYDKGMVGGAYADIPFNVYINYNTQSFINADYLKKYDCTVAEALAGFFTHEIGHAFGGIMMIHQTVSDNFQARAALHCLGNAKYEKDRVTVIKDFAKLADVDQKELKDVEALAAKNNTDEYFVYLNKLTKQRDLNNAAGLGVKYINSEVIADAYAIRMGCSKAMAAGLASMQKEGRKDYWFMVGWILVFPAIDALFKGMLLYFLPFAAVWIAISYGVLLVSQLTPSSYNTYYRRVMNIAQEQIMNLKQSKDLSAADRSAMIDQINLTLKVAKDTKPWFEETGFQRTLGWLFTWGKFKYNDLEFYTQAISNHGINTLADEIKYAQGV